MSSEVDALTAAAMFPSDRFDVRGVVGTGAMGRVYRVHDRAYGLDVAAKVLEPGAVVEKDGLQREFRAVSGLVHPNLVSLLELHARADRPDEQFYTMELVADATALEPGPRPEVDIVRDMAQVVAGLRALHRAGLVHNDLKPSNVLRCPRTRRVALADFGLVSLHGAMTWGGSPRYAAPELWDTGIGDTATDRYALGVLLYEALTGRPAFGDTIEEVLAAKSLAFGLDPGPAVRPALRELVVALTSKPAHRPGLEDIARVLGAGDAGLTRPLTRTATRFIGREVELDRLARARAQCREGARRLVLITGATGSGRSALVEVGLAGLRGPRLTARPGEHLPGRLHRDLCAALHAPDAAPREVARALRRETGSQPLLVLDDLHLADGPSLLQLASVLAEVEGGVFVVATWQDQKGLGPRSAALEQFVSRAGLEREDIALAPLPPEQALTLGLALGLDEAAARSVAEDGNPGLVALLAAGGPHGLVAGLPADALGLARLLAASAIPTPMPVLRHACGDLDDARVVAALGALRARRLVSMLPVGVAPWPTVSLAHSWLGEVFLGTAAGGVRVTGHDLRALHLALADAWLAHDPASTLPIVTHLFASGDAERERTAIAIASAAADRASAEGHPHEVALHLGLVVDRGGNREARGQLIEALEACGSLVEAGRRCLASAEQDPAGVNRWRIRALVDLMLGGALVEGHRVLDALRSSLGPTLGRRPGLLRIAVTTVWHHYIGTLTKRLEPIAAGPTGTPALSHEDELAVLRALALGHAVTDPMASAYYQVLHMRSALRQLEPEPLVRALAIHLMHATASGVGARRLTIARSRLASWVERADTPTARAIAAVSEAGAAWLSGRADEALELAERAQHLLDATPGGVDWERGSLAIVRCALLEETSAWPRLDAVCRELLSAARERGDVHLESQLLARASVMVALAHGDAPRARAELSRARDLLLGDAPGMRLEALEFNALRAETGALIVEGRGAEALAFVETATRALRGGVVLRTAYHRALVDIARVEARLAAAVTLSGRERERLVAGARRLARHAQRRANPLHAQRLAALEAMDPEQFQRMGAPAMAPTRTRTSFPRAALEGQRQALGPQGTPLRVVSGALPAGLSGAWYVIAADGDFTEARALSRRAFLPFLNGDGFVAKLAFGPDGVVAMRRAVETPCFIADREAALRGDPALAFVNFGITRASPRLGLRNQANTALQAVTFDGRTRLLATYDAGTPVELDPLDLSFVRPIGHAHEWLGSLGRTQPFRTLTSSAHPAWDPREGALYLFEGGRPRSAFTAAIRRLVARRRPDADELAAIDLLDGLGPEEKLRAAGWLGSSAPFADFPDLELLDEGDEGAALDTMEAWLRREEAQLDAELAALDASPTDTSLRDLARFVLELGKAAIGRAWRLITGRRELVPPGIGPTAPFGRLLVWRGTGGERMLDAHELRVCDGTDEGRALSIVASAHQLISTRHFVVVFDTTFKFETDLAAPIDEGHRRFAHLLRARMSAPQPHLTVGYVIRKRDLGTGGRVFSRAFTVPAEIVHLVADYADEDGRAIVIHAVDNRATDPAEFLLADDRQGWDPSAPVPAEVLSMMPCGLEVNALASYRIDVPGGEWRSAEPLAVTELGRVADHAHTWTIGLGASHELFGPRPQPERVTESCWYTQGLEASLVSDIVLGLYREHPRRETPLGEVERRARAGVGPRILRVRHDAAAGEFRLLDVFALPTGMLACSVHVAHDRWILCTTFGRPAHADPEVPWMRDIAERELWVFDKASLARGPIARLDATALAWPYTLHASWIDEADLPTTPVDPGERFGTGPSEFRHVPLDERRVRDFLGEIFGWAGDEAMPSG